MPGDLFSILRTRAARVVLKTSIAVGIALCAAGPLAMQAHAAGGPIVQTNNGGVQGFFTKGVAEFLGIPYAAPPLGNLRWRPPVAHEPWKGVLSTIQYGPTCAQIYELGVFAGPPNNNEDCLYLNVFTPNLDPSAHLPVVVWIYGGGHFDGESNDYDASKLASNGKTVVVTFNYRLNLMGFFAHPALDNEGHLFGNYGILDQQFALKWMRQNIAKFGGDKNNVTLAGQSAGATNTGLNVVSPLAAGLFNRAIYESAAPVTQPLLSTAVAQGTAFAVAAGCGPGTGPAVAKCLRNLTAAQIEALSGTETTRSAYLTDPFVDGTIIPIQPIEAWHNGQFNHMPMMNGRTADEENFNLAITEYFSGPPRVPPTAAQYLNYIKTNFEPSTYPAGTAAKVLSHYPLAAYASPQLAWDALVTDWNNQCVARHINKILANQVSLYAYSFDDRTAPFYFPKMPGLESLAYHTSDLQYLFPLFHGGPLGIVHPLNAKQEKLSDELVAAWTNFAWTGNPNGQGTNPWPRFTNNAIKAAYLSENIPALSTYTDAQFSALHKCDFWDTILPNTYGPGY